MKFLTSIVTVQFFMTLATCQKAQTAIVDPQFLYAQSSLDLTFNVTDGTTLNLDSDSVFQVSATMNSLKFDPNKTTCSFEKPLNLNYTFTVLDNFTAQIQINQVASVPSVGLLSPSTNNFQFKISCKNMSNPGVFGS